MLRSPALLCLTLIVLTVLPSSSAGAHVCVEYQRSPPHRDVACAGYDLDGAKGAFCPSVRIAPSGDAYGLAVCGGDDVCHVYYDTLALGVAGCLKHDPFLKLVGDEMWFVGLTVDGLIP